MMELTQTEKNRRRRQNKKNALKRLEGIRQVGLNTIPRYKKKHNLTRKEKKELASAQKQTKGE